MLKWLKKKAGDKCKLEIYNNLKIFVALSNEADELLVTNKNFADEKIRTQIYTIQKKILLTIHLAIINGVTIEEICNEIIIPFIQENHCSEGAILGINHVLSYKSTSL
jgi:hypothetical protein